MQQVMVFLQAEITVSLEPCSATPISTQTRDDHQTKGGKQMTLSE
jgi:hypothetical protein